MKKRLITSGVIVAVYALAFFLQTVSPYIFDILIFVATYFAVGEVLKARKREYINKYFVYAYLLMAYILFIVISDNKGWIHLLVQVLLFATMTLYVWLTTGMDKKLAKHCSLQKLDHKKEVGKITKEYLFNFVYPGLLILSLLVINHINFFMKSDIGINAGLFGILTVFAISCFTDVFAYVVGSNFKGQKLLPQKFQYISPNKTISGAVGGVIGGIVGVLIVFAFFVDGNEAFSNFLYSKIDSLALIYLVIIAIGILGSVFNQIGDIYASYQKRKAGIKDFGSFMPGHGGVMDRLDGVCFNSVFMMFALLIILV